MYTLSKVLAYTLSKVLAYTLSKVLAYTLLMTLDTFTTLVPQSALRIDLDRLYGLISVITGLKEQLNRVSVTV